MRSPLLAHFDGRGRVSLDTLSDGYNQAVLGPGEGFVWDFHPSIAIGICVMIGLYVWIVGPARKRYNQARRRLGLSGSSFDVHGADGVEPDWPSPPSSRQPFVQRSYVSAPRHHAVCSLNACGGGLCRGLGIVSQMSL